MGKIEAQQPNELEIRRKIKREALTLEELSFITAFFTLMAKSHLIHLKLYNQLKSCIFERTKENDGDERDESMIK